MKIKSQRDFVSGIMLIVIGLAFAIGATNYSFGSNIRPGPGYFPFGLGIILAILGGVVFFRSLRSGPENGDPIGRMPWRALFCVVGSIVFFGFCLPRLGFIISFPIMIVFTSMAGQEFTWRDALLNALILTVMSYLIFIAGLSLNIPLWPAFL